ncbi:MAG: hypothetical protein WEB93_02240, partial [Sphingomonadales bacterium]
MSALPGKFSELEPFAAVWALPTENQRSARRWESAAADFQSFYDAMMPRLDEVLAHLDTFRLGEMPDDARRLYHLALAFAEASPHTEMY